MKEEAPNRMREAVERVRRDGDVLDGCARIGSRWKEFAVGYTTLVPSVLLAGMAQSLGGYRVISDPSALLAVPFFGANAAIAWGAGYYMLRRKETRDVTRTSGWQDEVRAGFNEAVDLLQNSSSSLGRQLYLRWYGSETGSSTDQLVRRFAQLSERASDCSIEHIIMGTSWLNEAGYGNDVLATYGQIENGSLFVGDLKTKEVVDSCSDPEIIVMKTAEAQRLAAELFRRGGVKVNMRGEELVDFIATAGRHRSNVPRLYTQYLAEGTAELYGKLLTALRDEIAELAQEAVVAHADTPSGRHYGQRFEVSSQVVGDKIVKFGHGRTSTGMINAHLGSESLLQHSGVAHQSDLERRLALGQSKELDLDARVALYLKLVNDSADALGNVKPVDEHKTLFQLFQAEPPRTFLRPLAKYGRNHAKGANTIEYRRIRSNKARMTRLLAGTALAALQFTGWQSIGLGVNNTVHALAENYDTAPTRVAVDGLEVWEGVTDQIQATAEDIFGHNGSQSDSPNRYVSSSSMSFGDVDKKGGQAELFSIEALHPDASLAGYWVTNVFDRLSVQTSGPDRAPTYPLADTSLTAEQTNYVDSLELSLPASPGAHETIFYRLSTRQLDDDETYLPYKSGTKVIAAQIRETDPSAPQFRQSPEPIAIGHGGNSIFYIDIPRALPKYSQPELIYWLGPSDQGIKIDKSMVLGDNHGEASLPAETSEAVLARLGLSSSGETTLDDVVETIRRKKYSLASRKFRSRGDVQGHSKEEAFTAAAESAAATQAVNCNLATLALIGATGGWVGDKPLNMAAGFLNNNDTVLRVKESHAFVLQAEGNGSRIIDPTPSEQELKLPKEWPLGAAVLGVGLGGLLAYRGRRRIYQVSVKTVDTANKRLLMNESTAPGIAVIKDALYGELCMPSVGPFESGDYMPPGRSSAEAIAQLGKINRGERRALAASILRGDRYSKSEKVAALNLLARYGSIRRTVSG